MNVFGLLLAAIVIGGILLLDRYSVSVKNKQVIKKVPSRKQYPVLTKEILESLQDSDLEWAVESYVALKTNYGVNYEAFKSLSKGMRMVYSTWWVEGEVNNGGFNQYFLNTEGKYYKDAIEGYDLVGASEFLSVLKQAVKAYEKGETKKPIENKFAMLDEKFMHDMNYGELSKKRNRYIRKHVDQFVGN